MNVRRDDQAHNIVRDVVLQVMFLNTDKISRGWSRHLDPRCHCN